MKALPLTQKLFPTMIGQCFDCCEIRNRDRPNRLSAGLLSFTLTPCFSNYIFVYPTTYAHTNRPILSPVTCTMPDKCKERERISASSIVEVPALPVAAVRGQLCFRCFSPAEKITKCAGCKRAGYCSRVCQKIDWAFSHKKQCKVLREVNELDLNEYRASRTWDEYRMALV